MINGDNSISRSQGLSQTRSRGDNSGSIGQQSASVSDLYEKVQSGDMTLKEFKEAMASGKYDAPLQNAAGALAESVVAQPEQPKFTR